MRDHIYRHGSKIIASSHPDRHKDHHNDHHNDHYKDHYKDHYYKDHYKAEVLTDQGGLLDVREREFV